MDGFVIIVISLIGTIICYKCRNNVLYRYGMWFFNLTLLSSLYSLILDFILIDYYFAELRERGVGMQQIGTNLALLGLPAGLLKLASLIVLVLGFYKYGDGNKC